ncbi:caspase family protein [Oceanibacterium hippocampi]|uniref:Caspase domain protein n=1 Tax=Oceanibacterium hippocampi TaxID=745714 RepID=A0A1Y5S880_9PROT|nr:caspase family protein [Oceanibacterium hippocampi]SLN32313.1 Caspase domain protein [Oceanibacterium hippocampi]
MRFIAIIALLVAVLASGPAHKAYAEIEFGRYEALVIGINDYRDLPRLKTAVNDASAVHDLLMRRYGFNSTLLLNPSRYELVRALDEMRGRLTEQDNLLVYYAGHGVLDEAADQGFWLPIDAEKDSQANWVSIATVTATLRAVSAKHVLVVSDSCYSGTLTRDAPIVIPTGAEREAELRRISTKRARKALTSGGLEPVADGGGDGHSVFARALLETLEKNDDVLDGHQLYSRLRRPVITNSAQTPLYADIRFANDQGGDFLFVPRVAVYGAPPPPAPAAAASSPDQSLALDMAFWNSVKDSRNEAMLNAYLARFPAGVFAELARIKIASLQTAAPAAPAAIVETPAPAPAEAPAAAPVADALQVVASRPEATEPAAQPASQPAAELEGSSGIGPRIEDLVRPGDSRRPDLVASIAARDALQMAAIYPPAPSVAPPPTYTPSVPAVASPSETFYVKSVTTVWTRPELFSSRVGTLQDIGSLAPVIGRTSDGSWLHVRLPDGNTGWVAANALSRTPIRNESGASEAAEWQEIQYTKDRSAIERYLQKYPNGPYSGLARWRLEEIRSPLGD